MWFRTPELELIISIGCTPLNKGKIHARELNRKTYTTKFSLNQSFESQKREGRERLTQIWQHGSVGLQHAEFWAQETWKCGAIWHRGGWLYGYRRGINYEPFSGCFTNFLFGGAYLRNSVVVVIKIEKKMKEEDVFDSSGRCGTNKMVSMHLKMKREIRHFTLSSMGIYLVECTLYFQDGRQPRWRPMEPCLSAYLPWSQ